MIAVLLLIFFSILNPFYIYSLATKGVEKRKKQNKDYFDLFGINLISLKNKAAPILITLIYLIGSSISISLILISIGFIFPVALNFLKFPFQFSSNINNSNLYYGVYGFLFLNIINILIKPQESTKAYFLKFSVYYWSCFISFCICAIFMIFNMIFYFNQEEIKSDVFTDKSKIAYAMCFNLCFIVVDYLKEKKIIFNDNTLD